MGPDRAHLSTGAFPLNMQPAGAREVSLAGRAGAADTSATWRHHFRARPSLKLRPRSGRRPVGRVQAAARLSAGCQADGRANERTSVARCDQIKWAHLSSGAGRRADEMKDCATKFHFERARSAEGRERVPAGAERMLSANRLPAKVALQRAGLSKHIICSARSRDAAPVWSRARRLLASWLLAGPTIRLGQVRE